MLALPSEIAIAVGLLALLFGGLELGFRFGRRAAAGGDAGGGGGGQIGAIQGAILGLLGLLLGFSFAGAASRFIERQDLIVTEGNAIGTAWLRADVLPDPHRGRLKGELAQYVRHRIESSRQLQIAGYTEEMKRAVEGFHDRIWRAAADGVLATPAAMVAVLDPVNDVIDLHTTRVAAGRKHLPLPILGLLVACSALAVGVIGFGCGMSGRRALPMTVSLVLLIAAALWITIDLDHPRAGLIRLNDAPLQELKLEPERT